MPGISDQLQLLQRGGESRTEATNAPITVASDNAATSVWCRASDHRLATDTANEVIIKSTLPTARKPRLRTRFVNAIVTGNKLVQDQCR